MQNNLICIYFRKIDQDMLACEGTFSGKLSGKASPSIGVGFQWTLGGLCSFSGWFPHSGSSACVSPSAERGAGSRGE